MTIPEMVVADGFVSTSGGQPIFQAYSRVHADATRSTAAALHHRRRPADRPAHTLEPVDDTITAAAISRMATSIRTLSRSTFGLRDRRPGGPQPAPRWVTISATSPASSISTSPTASSRHQLRISTRSSHHADPSSRPDRQRRSQPHRRHLHVENLDPGDGAARFAALAAATPTI